MAASNGHSYKFGFGSWHGTEIPRPGLAKFLFQCEFNLFGQIAAPGQGVWTPYPRGRYVCNGELPGMVRVDLDENNVGWKMAYHDLAFVLKVLHDSEAVKDKVPFFDFHVIYTPETEGTPEETVAYGSWDSVYR